MGPKKMRIVPVRRESEFGGEHAFGIQVLGPGAKFPEHNAALK